jgi:hypothetical protein
MFGLKVINNQESVLVSDNSPVLVYSQRGQIVVQNTSVVDRPAVGTVVFATPVTQTLPPRVFIRFASGRHSSCSIYMTMNGSAGNWTGMTIRAGALGGSTLPRHVLDYVVCVYSLSNNLPSYGMVVFNADGVPVYRSDDRVVRFSKFTKSWTEQNSGSYHLNYLPSNITIDEDDFIEISQMNRGNANMNLFGGIDLMFTSMSILSNSVRTLRLVIQFTTQNRNGQRELGSTLFCIPICKFPITDYP